MAQSELDAKDLFRDSNSCISACICSCLHLWGWCSYFRDSLLNTSNYKMHTYFCNFLKVFDANKMRIGKVIHIYPLKKQKQQSVTDKTFPAKIFFWVWFLIFRLNNLRFFQKKKLDIWIMINIPTIEKTTGFKLQLPIYCSCYLTWNLVIEKNFAAYLISQANETTNSFYFMFWFQLPFLPRITEMTHSRIMCVTFVLQMCLSLFFVFWFCFVLQTIKK